MRIWDSDNTRNHLRDNLLTSALALAWLRE